MVLGSQDNIALAAHSHIDMVSAQNTQISTGNKFLLRATEQISLFVHKLGMKLIAASGKIIIQAQNDNVEVTAAKLFDMTGLEEIIIQAPKITWISQDTQTVMGGGNVTTQCMGAHTEHAGKHVRMGPAGSSLVLPEMPVSSMPDRYSQRVNVQHWVGVSPEQAALLDQAPYEYRTLDGKLIAAGALDAEGNTRRAYTPVQKKLHLWIGDGEWRLFGDAQH